MLNTQNVSKKTISRYYKIQFMVVHGVELIDVYLFYTFGKSKTPFTKTQI